MKIDQSICNDWTLSPLENSLKLCVLKITMNSECVSSFVCRCSWDACVCVSSLVWARVCCFSVTAHAGSVADGHCLYPEAVLPVRSQVFINLDSGRRITEPQAATHPSLQRLPKTAFNTHYSFPGRYQPHFQPLGGFASHVWVCSSGMWSRQRSCVYLLRCNFCSLWFFAIPPGTPDEVFPV